MSFQPLFLLGGSCIFALGLALMAFSSGFGVLAAFMIYSFSGSAMLVLLSLFSFLKLEEPTSEFAV